jgi:aldehyde:ferredoxin oxidoreductase
MNGFVGQILRVNLSDRSFATEALDLSWARQYLGGSGLGARYLFEELAPGADPLGPENKLIVATGPLSGTLAPGCARHSIVTKSPLSGGLGDGTAAGGFGAELKYAGFDLIIIEGVADSPVYISIKDGGVEIRDAFRLWGSSVGATEDALHDWHGRAAQVVSIGPAGENLVRFATPVTAYYRGYGRSGLGAVFGAKRLKAVVARGNGSVGVADPVDFASAARRAFEAMAQPGSVRVSRLRGGPGTPSQLESCAELGLLGSRNHAGSASPESARIGVDASRAAVVADRSCMHCPVACKGHVSLSGTECGDVDAEFPELESWAQLGANCGVSDPAAVVKANQLCVEMGMDAGSAGVAVAWALEAAERGELKAADPPEPMPGFGDVAGILALLEDVALRRGVGDQLADGVGNASAQCGDRTGGFAMQVNGMAMPAYDPRAAVALALGYATTAGGAHHTRTFSLVAEVIEGGEAEERHSPLGKAGLVACAQDRQALRGGVGACDLAWCDVDQVLLTDLVASSTGWEAPPDLAEAVGGRVYSLARLFDLREGLALAQGGLPARLSEDALPDGVASGHRVSISDFESMLAEYRQARGWDGDGKPLPEMLSRLGIGELATVEGGGGRRAPDSD